MKRLTSVLLTVTGIGLVLLGLLFLMASAGKAYRALIGVVSLGAGGALAGLGVRLFKAADAASPAQLRAEILALARREDGEVAEGEVFAALGRRAAGAGAVLEAMVREGQCRRHQAAGTTTYVFEGLKPRLLVLRCEFCDAELPLNEPVTSCPNCGGTVKSQLESRSLEERGHYRMDE